MAQRAVTVPQNRMLLILIGVSSGLILLALGPVLFASRADRSLWQAAEALTRHDFAQAQQLAQQALQENPAAFAAALIAGEAAAGQHEHERAIEYFSLIPETAGDLAIRAHLGIGERSMKLGDLPRAEENFEKVLRQWPDDSLANQRYGYLMQIQGRTLESVEPTLRLIRQGLFGATEIHIVGCPENRFLFDERLLELARRTRPDDFRPQLATTRLSVLKNEPVAAAETYAALIDQGVKIADPYIRLGRIYLDRNEPDRFVELDSKLPPNAELQGGVWVNRGQFQMRNERFDVAARCFYEALLRQPTHVEATYLLSQALVQLNKKELAARVGVRAKTLARIELSIPEFYDDPAPERMQKLVKDFDSVGRYWEAAAMCDFALRYYEKAPTWAKIDLHYYANQIRMSGGTLFSQQGLLELRFLEKIAVPKRLSESVQSQLVRTTRMERIPIRFENRASDVGLEMTYFNGSRSSRGMEHIFETTGGGLAAIDFDQDGWTDLYCTQGAAIWKGDDQVERLDKMFRNAEGAFEDVTDAANLRDVDFSQGVTVGDFNNDGFPDLYVCNLYGNRFYENNGDGTWTDITRATGTGGDEWSLSCVLADLNGDSLPDLYVVNYLDRASVFDRRCKQNGHPLTCAPTMFPAAQDRVYLNSGDGRFRDVTEESGVVYPEGKGLAILAADFDQSRRISLFIGNDTTPNFLLMNKTTKPGGLRFEEEGLISGLALDGGGRSQATMGIAFGNVLGSELSELFITNFYGDANTFYVQDSPGLFVDYTRQAALREPSLTTLGFGTEFVDADLDGELDLFVTNGHVDRTFATGEPDEMPPQLFDNTGGGKYELLPAAGVGRYFEGAYLGRSVSRLDWNRDGRDDLCVLHLYTPIALLTNETRSSHHYLQLKLVGQKSARDAIGTIVEVVTGDQKRTHQLVAGDGYMTSNERLLTIGLGSKSKIDSLTVRWPSGTEQTYHEVPLDRRLLVVEEMEELLISP